ncbi:DUF4221 family protein [Cognataquiflexum rubidum]|uniref:DUF4221 family protein n=1 Tax=Cognataquiflexum rubidum TaxID=2922273 RepID=UPI001F1453BA|nr:DUF4221 family protein [Cognataquiflexum rubidum]MCH6236541.1 DUF4221 domain-containing protein [Cognataquiflexum rubidum]
MRYLTFIIIVCIALSCQSNDVDRISDDLFYEIDTVIIDSKGRNLDLNSGMITSDLDAKETSFFLYNGFDHAIDEINLEAKEFVKSYPLEKEGANGVGEYIFGIQSLNDSLFFTKSNILSTVIDNKGQVVQRIGWEDAKDSSGAQLEQLPRYLELVSGIDDAKAFGVHFDFQKVEAYLDVLSVSDNTIKRVDIDTENSFQDFFFRFEDGSFLNPAVHLSSGKDNFIISHEFSNEIMVFNHEGELVKIVHYEPKLTPKRANVPEGAEAKSTEQIKKDYQQMLEQVKFESLVWDSVNDRYFRLSSKRIFSDTYQNEWSLVPETKQTILFLSVFDGDFNLVSEKEIKELTDNRFKYFAKEGKLWVAQNFSDDLGFIVIDIELD